MAQIITFFVASSKFWRELKKNETWVLSFFFTIIRVTAPVVDHVSVVDYFSEKHENMGKKEKYGF